MRKLAFLAGVAVSMFSSKANRDEQPSQDLITTTILCAYSCTLSPEAKLRAQSRVEHLVPDGAAFHSEDSWFEARDFAAYLAAKPHIICIVRRV